MAAQKTRTLEQRKGAAPNLKSAQKRGRQRMMRVKNIATRYG
jgi:hypothetical protein